MAEINSPAGRRKATAGCATHHILQPNAHTFILMSTHEKVDGLKWRRDFKRQCQERKPRETQGGHKKTVIFWSCRSLQLHAWEGRNRRQNHIWMVPNKVPGRGFAWMTRSRDGRRSPLVGICQREKFKIHSRFPSRRLRLVQRRVRSKRPRIKTHFKYIHTNDHTNTSQ